MRKTLETYQASAQNFDEQDTAVMESVHIFDIIIGAAYFAMPIELLYFTYKLPLRDWKTYMTCLLFCMFIGFCGVTHILHIYELTLTNKVVYGITALISAATVVVLFLVIPHILGLPAKLEIVRKHGQLQRDFAMFVRRITSHTTPSADPFLLLVACQILKNIYPDGRVRLVAQADLTADSDIMVSRDDSTLLMVDRDLYEQNIWFFNEITIHMRLLTEPAKPLPGVDRILIT